ncbi:MAG: type II toxin-antitoxin system HicA family toxin [Actinomycetota bacterium]|nr:type II toxin-antitoxin system HicA family toxin [Actinomycetota bacterium]
MTWAVTEGGSSSPSGRLPALSGGKVVKALERAGFAVARVSGSHHVLRHPDGRVVVVPVQPARLAGCRTMRPERTATRCFARKMGRSGPIRDSRLDRWNVK